MIQLTRTYKDFNGNERTEDFMFNLTSAEVLDLELSENGGLSEIMKKLSSQQDIKEIIKIFRNIVSLAYGEKSADGRLFEKSPELTRKFMATQAYSDIYYELVTDVNKASAFINAIVPSDLREKMNEISANNNGPVAVLNND